MEFKEIAQVVYDLGTVGVLLYFTIAFVTGKIVSAKVHDEQIQLAASLAQKAIANGFKDTVRDAVRLGFIEAWHEISITLKEGK